MRVCSGRGGVAHEEICFDGDARARCPLCVALDGLHDALTDHSRLEGTVAALEGRLSLYEALWAASGGREEVARLHGERQGQGHAVSARNEEG